MLSRLWRWLTQESVTREQYNEMRMFYQQQVIDLRKALEDVTRALVEERSPGTVSRLAPVPPRPKPAPEEGPEHWEDEGPLL